MKKIFVLILCMVLFLCLCACNNDTLIQSDSNNDENNSVVSDNNNGTDGTNNDENDNSITSPEEDTGIADNPVLVDNVVFENEYMKMTLTNIEFRVEDENHSSLFLYFSVNNKMDSQLTIDSDCEHLNAFETRSMSLYSQIESGQTKDIFCYYSSDCTNANGLSTLEDINAIGFVLTGRDEERNVEFESNVCIYPNKHKEYTMVGHNLKETDRVLVDNDDVYIVLKGYRLNDRYETISCDFYIQNKSNKEIIIQLSNAYIDDNRESGVPAMFKLSGGRESNTEFSFWPNDDVYANAKTLKFFVSMYNEYFQEIKLTEEIIIDIVK